MIQCHNACIVTKNEVDVEEIEEYLRNAMTNMIFKKYAVINIYSGAHGVANGELTEKDEGTASFHSNVCNIVPGLYRTFGENISKMGYTIMPPKMVGKSPGESDVRYDHEYIATQDLSALIQDAVTPGRGKPTVFFFAFC